MKRHILNTFIKENFKKEDKIDLDGISLFYGRPGSGKTYLLNKLFSKYDDKILYIGRDFERELYFKNIKYIGSEDIYIDYNKLELAIEKYIKKDYFIIFDEVFWENEIEYLKMIERIIINNKLNIKLILSRQFISNKDDFDFERITKNLSQVISFANSEIEADQDLEVFGRYNIYKRKDSNKLTNKQINNFQKN